MTESLIERVLDIFNLTDEQRSAALERGRDVVVTAGAGSGKTLTLVARYASLLAEGKSPRRVAAITFTKKAAREMRSRVRMKLTELQQITQNEAEHQMWVDLLAQMDSARIGTIHSLCTEILRAHPAEAGIDPRFEVLDEGVSAALRIQAVEDTLKNLVEQEKYKPLLYNISTQSLTEMLQYLLERRLEADETFEIMVDHRARIAAELKARMNDSLVSDLITDLRSMSPDELKRDAGDKLAEMVRELLQLWTEAEIALAEGNPVSCAVNLYQARREKMRLRPGKAGAVKDLIAVLQENYDKLLNPLTNGKNSKDPLPSTEVEDLFGELLPLLRDAFDAVHQVYKDLVSSRQALDFNDLEYGAQQLLLHREDIRTRWQGELDALLVDEFQDTNVRQRDIIEALAGSPGRLFIVGDSRQSIYRFRRADVTVFSDIQRRIRNQSGFLIDLDRTFRAHEPLLQATGDLLAEVIGTEPDPARKYYVPYTPLVANEKFSPEEMKPPHVEFVFGAGEDTDAARPVAARALAERLLQLKAERQIENWDKVALLFRASTGFPYYEEALEVAGIPFVTVAGRGFYDRPEIRDLINILRALGDPLDDLSFAGLLRSPAFGLSDAALFLLRQTGQSYWSALQGDLSILNEYDQQSAIRTRKIISSLLPLVDRVPVAELLKQVVDAVNYRAILATADMKIGDQDASKAGGRLWRNLDKLLEDARASSEVSVRSFLDLLKTLNDAGAREGEAPAEAEGTVRLMTIHRSKGLEFPVVVLADAGREGRRTGEQVYLSADLGVAIKLDPAPMLYNLARHLDKDQEDCEKLRVLYVALTRAKHKLIISGHATLKEEGKISVKAWAKDITEAAELDPGEFLEAEGEPIEFQTISSQPLRAWCLLTDLPTPITHRLAAKPEKLLDSDLPPLYRPVEDESVVDNGKEEKNPEEQFAWRSKRDVDDVPGNVLGKMVHKAIERWFFPGNSHLMPLLEAAAFNAGLASEIQRTKAFHRALELLERLRGHPIWEVIDKAQDRYHELPYSIQVAGRAENRYIDLLYQGESGWQVVDFKTDPINSPAQKEELLKRYIPQVRRYCSAVKQMLGVNARASICFLDDHGRVELVEVV